MKLSSLLFCCIAALFVGPVSLWSQALPQNDNGMVLVNDGSFYFYDPPYYPSWSDYNLESGNLSSNYYISQQPVSIGQYCDCLNAVARRDDRHGLYCNMDTLIVRTEIAPNIFHYAPQLDQNGNDQSSAPMSAINRDQAMRYCNWKENGSLDAVGVAQFSLINNAEVTEMGSYNFGSSENFLNADESALYHLPSQSEFINAAFQGAITLSNNFEWTDFYVGELKTSACLLNYTSDQACSDSDDLQNRKTLPVIDCLETSPGACSGPNGETFNFYLAKRIPSIAGTMPAE